MRHCTVQHGNTHEILLGRLYTLSNSGSNLASLTKTPADDTILVTNYNDGCECESTSTLCNLGYAIDGNELVLEFDIATYSYLINCHIHLRI